MRKALRACFACLFMMTAVWAVIHRRVIAACINGKELPEPPEWHKKWFGKLHRGE